MKYILIFFLFFSPLYSETIFILVRHGQTDWNKEGRVQGISDIPLNEEGRAQAKKRAEELQKNHSDLTQIYSSDLIRAYETAYETARLFHLPIHRRNNLRELDCGSTEGMLTKEKEALYKEQWAELDLKYPIRKERWDHTPIPGEETLNHLATRMRNELNAIAEAHPDEKVAIFTHGKALQTLLADIRDVPLDQVKIPKNGEEMVLTWENKN